MGQLKVVMFSGGSGTATIAQSLIDQGVDLTLVVNCYDDGLSTGELRKAIPGMLGPSDIRKNVARFAFDAELGRLLERRVVFQDAAKYQAQFDNPELFRWLNVAIGQLATKSLHDCPLGNLVFAGCYFTDGADTFNMAVDRFQQECACECTWSVKGENLQLRACAPEGFGDMRWYSEAEISTAGIHHPFAMLKFEPDVYPELNLDVAEALAACDLIVYGPGTQHSSLLPSYLTRGLAEAICNTAVPKVYIANLTRDRDIGPNETFENLTKKLVVCMSRYGAVPVEWHQLVTHTIIDKSSWGAETWTRDLGTVYLGRFGNAGGVHLGASIAQSLLATVLEGTGRVQTRSASSKRHQTAS